MFISISVIFVIYVLDMRGSEYDYEVRHKLMNGDLYSINLLRNECSCRKWLLTGLPCCHVLSCMKGQDIDVGQYAPNCFRKERYEACYSHIIYQVNGQPLWRRTEFTDLQPPRIKRKPRRPKKNRRKDDDEKRDEQQLKRAKNGIKCSRCKAEGCNKSTCKLLPPPPPPATQPTAVNLLQLKLLLLKCLLLNLLLLSVCYPNFYSAFCISASTHKQFNNKCTFYDYSEDQKRFSKCT